MFLQAHVADVLSKWEKYEAHDIHPDGGTWVLVFKLFSLNDARSTKLSETEQQFLYEHAFESVVYGRFPANDESLIKLGALRAQVCYRINEI